MNFVVAGLEAGEVATCEALGIAQDVVDETRAEGCRAGPFLSRLEVRRGFRRGEGIPKQAARNGRR